MDGQPKVYSHIMWTKLVLNKIPSMEYRIPGDKSKKLPVFVRNANDPLRVCAKC